MSTHCATVRWTRARPDHAYDTYVRDHSWVLGSGQAIRASAAHEYKGNASLTNPEEAFVAALSSCHMLTFLAIAARRRYLVDTYEDDAEGRLTKRDDGRMWLSHVILRPAVRFSGDRLPDADEIARLHRRAHEECFIANSVATDVRVEAPRVEGATPVPRGLLDPDPD